MTEPQASGVQQLLAEVARLHSAGQSPADADLFDALGRLAPHAAAIGRLLGLGEQLAHGMQCVVLHHGQHLTPGDCLTRGGHADEFMAVLESVEGPSYG